MDAFLDVVEAALRDPMGRILTAEQVSDAAFAKPPRGKFGYNEDEVDAFLDLVETALRYPTGRTLTPEDVRNAAFSDPPRGERGYNRDEVDAFLNLLEEEIRRRVTGIPRNTQPARPWNR
ncbi:hypothetical protein MHAE_07624 [Mycobacterium haemophilum DSM 44634]